MQEKINYHTFNSLRRNISKCTTCGQGVDAPEHMEKPLDDLDPMPFGMHKGKPMQDVPAKYLHWLWTRSDRGIQLKERTNVGSVYRYIESRIEHMKKEHPDGFWN